MIDLAKGWARAGAWAVVTVGGVAMLLGASALSFLAAGLQSVVPGAPQPKSEPCTYFGCRGSRCRCSPAACATRAEVARLRQQARIRRRMYLLERDTGRAHRKALRRGSVDSELGGRRGELAQAVMALRMARQNHQFARVMVRAHSWESPTAEQVSALRAHEANVAQARAVVREAELRYAVACAAAGAVPR